jgi:hypothetical protein
MTEQQQQVHIRGFDLLIASFDVTITCIDAELLAGVVGLCTVHCLRELWQAFNVSTRASDDAMHRLVWPVDLLSLYDGRIIPHSNLVSVMYD